MENDTVIIISCAHPLSSRKPDPAYDGEVQVAREVGLEIGFLDFEALTDVTQRLKAWH